MPTYDSSAAECLLYSFKEGLLARLAHDLKLRVTDLQVTIETNGSGTPTVQAAFDARSVTVLCFRRDGQDDPRSIGASDRSQIEKNLHEDVLDSARFPQARFASTAVTQSADGFIVRGTLTLHGRTAELTAPVRRIGDRYLATVTLRPSQFGIKPYSAALGALRVRDEVLVTLSVPLPTPAAP